MSLADKRSLWAEEVRTLRVMKQKLQSVNTSKTFLWTPFYLYSYSEQALQVSTSTPCIVLFEKVQYKVCLSARLLIYKYYTCLGCNLHKNHKKMRWPFLRNNKQENKKEHAWRLVTNKPIIQQWSRSFKIGAILVSEAFEFHGNNNGVTYPRNKQGTKSTVITTDSIAVTSASDGRSIKQWRRNLF